MWRSWVDRVNAASQSTWKDNSYEDQSTLSLEEQKRREQERDELQALLDKTQSPTSSEQENDTVFLQEFLPRFCTVWESNKDNVVFTAIDDARSFMACLTRLLLGGIRRVPEQKTKGESSKALMDRLRSKSHMYHIIRTIRVVSHGPDMLVDLMLQQRIPSVIIKLFRSFIDLPHDYYQPNEENDLMSIDGIGSLVTDTLKQFAQNKSVLRRLIAEDTLFMMIRLVTVKPAEWPAHSTLDGEPAFMAWKHRALEVLKQIPMSSDVCHYMKSRRCLEMLVQAWEDCFASKTRLTCLDMYEILSGIDLLTYQVETSLQSDYHVLYDDLNRSNAWDALSTVLLAESSDDHVTELKLRLNKHIARLVFIGRNDQSPCLPEGSPYQHEDFAFPNLDRSKGDLVRNIHAFQPLLSAFTYQRSKRHSGLESRIKKVLPDDMQRAVFDEMKQIISAEPINYFILERINAVVLLIESMEYHNEEIQNETMDILVYIIRDLNFVPLKELAVLSLYFQSSSSGKLIGLICRRFASLLQEFEKFQTVVREAGFLNVLSIMLSDMTDILTTNRDNDTPQQAFTQQVLQNFDAIADCIVEMIKNPANMALFQKTYRGHLLELLRIPATRSGTLRIIACFPTSTSSYNSDLLSSPLTPSASAFPMDIDIIFPRLIETLQSIPRENIDFRIDLLDVFHQMFINHPSTRDLFRQSGGYVTLISMIVSLENTLNDTSHDDLFDKRVKLLMTIFSVLASSMRDNDTNKHFFHTQVGYSALENSLTLTGALERDGLPQHMFGMLFAFAIDDQRACDLFTTDDGSSLEQSRQKIERLLKDVSVTVDNPEIMTAILRMQSTVSYDSDLSEAILYAMYMLARSNRRNQIRLNHSGLMLAALQRVLPKEVDLLSPAMDKEKTILLDLVKKLMVMGVRLDELHLIFRGLGTCGHFPLLNGPLGESLMDLILDGVTRSRWPNFIQFDMTSSGHACLEVPALEDFPQSSSGYTFMAWFHIDRFDTQVPLMILTLFDADKAVFQLTIDPVSRKLQIHQLGVKQTIEFSSFTFQPGYWYHLSLVHQCSRLGINMSSISLYINGVCMEQTRCPYLSQPMTSTDLRAVLGTPREFAATHHPCTLTWDLGPVYLIEEVLESDVLCLFFNLGARYRSLFQDSLRQFQTYEASTALFLNLRSMTKSFTRRDVDHSVLASVMRGAGTASIPEDKTAMAFFACNSLADSQYSGLCKTGLSDAATQLIAGSIKRAKLILNASVPKVDAALTLPRVMGYLDGNFAVAHPFGVDESMWRIGGCAIPLMLVERSETPRMLCKAMRILCETIRYSWRNSEDMERCHGYEVLAYLLKQKRDLLTVELLELLLIFIGKNTTYPEESIINNPFAYRYLILNFEVWKKTSLDVQQAHLEQFSLFLLTSNKRQFNMKRLHKFHLVKRMLLAFRMHIYSKDLTPYVVSALKTVTLCNWSTESIRAIATFLASTISQDSEQPLQSADSQSSPDSEDGEQVCGFIVDASARNQVSKNVQMRNVVLEMLHDILCDTNSKELVNKFANTITNRWPLLFFGPHLHPYTVVLASRIVSRILTNQGPSYVNKFRQTSEGFTILNKLLPHYWHLVQLHQVLTITMMGADISSFPLQKTFDIEDLKLCLRSDSSKFMIPDLLPIVIGLLKEGMANALVRTRKNDEDPTVKEMIGILDNLLLYLRTLYQARGDFRDMCVKPEVVDAMIAVIYPAIASTDQVLNAADELALGEGIFTLVMSADGLSMDDQSQRRGDEASSIIRRGGTSTLMTKTSPHTSRKLGAMITKLRTSSAQPLAPTEDMIMLKDEALHGLLDFLVTMSVHSIIDPHDKNLIALNNILGGSPPSTQESQIRFESFLLIHISQNLKSTLQLDDHLLADSKIVANVARFCQMAADLVLQGRFTNGAEQTYDLLASILERLISPEFSGRSKPSNQTLQILYRSFNRMILLKISDLEQVDMPAEQIVAFLNYCIHHQKIILSARNTDLEFLRCFCYHLYQFLLVDDNTVKMDAANVWKLLVLQRPDILETIFKVRLKGVESDDIVAGFREMIEMDTTSFFVWIESRKLELNHLFKEHIFKTWENAVQQENRHAQEMLKDHHVKRTTKLRRVQKREMYEEGLMREYVIKTSAWSSSIQDVEMGRFTKALQDNDGHDNFIVSEWTHLAGELLRERGLWGPAANQNDSKWRLDYTEGPQRMRKKIQRITEAQTRQYLPKRPKTSPAHNGKTSNEATDISAGKDIQPKPLIDVDDDMMSSPVAGKQDRRPSLPSSNGDQSLEGHAEERREEEEEISYDEDKNRKVLRLLDYGDMVLDVYNVSQIAGLDAREGLLLLCKQNIYLIDNFFQRADGEVVEIWDVPTEERDQYLILLAKAAGMETEPMMDQSGDLHTSRKWANNDIKEVYKRRFLFRDVALEIFFGDGRNALITVAKEERDELYSKLASRVTLFESSTESIIGAAGEREMAANVSSFGGSFKLSSLFGSSTLNDLTHMWQQREITNFQYLMYLNAIAGRSYNDLTQYPVFPWVLADYKSKELDFADPKTFRDLTKPMGAQTEERRAEFADRYKQWGETNNPEPAFHYGTHYSSAMIVCSFLIRLEPFTQHYLKLQGGTFDHADRLFDSIGKAYESASEKNMGDVRELIPEFFYLPEFLENVNKFDFGAKQGTGETIDSVLLPPWANGDPKIFIQRHREALESDYVSENLCHWIDLIFGYKQQGQAAIDALNVFHHVSYEGAVDLDAITDVVEKTATIGIINNFGQTPRQLFKKPHPTRLLSNQLPARFSPLQDHLNKVIQSIVPVRDIKRQVGEIGVYNERLGVTACQQLFMPPDGARYIEWGFSDNSLRLISTETGKLLHVYENMHTGFISTACFPDARTLVTGSTDSTICMWKIKLEKTTDFSLAECLRGHTGAVTCLAASRPYSVIVSGSEDKTAIIWDLNRREYVRTLDSHDGPVDKVVVNDATGDIITCSGNILRVWTINGELYLSKAVCSSADSILSCVVFENKTNDWYSDDLIVTGHKRGIIKFWCKNLVKGKDDQDQWGLVLKRQIQQHDQADDSVSDIVALSFAGPNKRTLLSGNQYGEVYAYVLPDTTDMTHYVRDDRYKDCMDCGRAFSVLERKNNCRSCGGLFCSGCMASNTLQIHDRPVRFCNSCYDQLHHVL